MKIAWIPQNFGTFDFVKIYNNFLQQLFTTIFYNNFLQQFFTTILYDNFLQHRQQQL